MKKILLVIGFCLAQCAFVHSAQAASCAGPQTGAWQGATVADFLTINDDCTFDYVGVGNCHTTGSYSGLSSAIGTGTAALTIDFSTGGNCMGAGQYSCWYDLQAQTLSFNCGYGSFSYNK